MTRAKPATTQISHSSMSSPLLCGAFRGDHLRVDAGPAEPAEETPMLDLHAMVLDDFEPRGLGAPACLGIHDPELHPQHLRPDRDRILGDGRDLGAFAEAIDDVDLFW